MKKLPFFGSKNKDEKSKESKQANENNNNNAINKQKLFGVPLAEIMSRYVRKRKKRKMNHCEIKKNGIENDTKQQI